MSQRYVIDANVLFSAFMNRIALRSDVVNALPRFDLP